MAVLSEGRSTGCAIADFNRDNWLDIAVPTAALLWSALTTSGWAWPRMRAVALQTKSSRLLPSTSVT